MWRAQGSPLQAGLPLRRAAADRRRHKKTSPGGVAGLVEFAGGNVERSGTGGNVTACTGIQAVALIAQAAAALATGTEAMVFRICEAIW